MPADWMPRTAAAAILPVRYGSSEKYSKLRPHSGLRLMHRPGPSSVPTPCETASSPMAAPTRSSSSTSQLLAIVTAVGKQVADAGGSVGELDGRDAQPLDGLGSEGGRSLEHGALLRERHLLNKVGVSHLRSFLGPCLRPDDTVRAAGPGDADTIGPYADTIGMRAGGAPRLRE